MIEKNNGISKETRITLGLAITIFVAVLGATAVFWQTQGSTNELRRDVDSLRKEFADFKAIMIVKPGSEELRYAIENSTQKLQIQMQRDFAEIRQVLTELRLSIQANREDIDELEDHTGKPGGGG